MEHVMITGAGGFIGCRLADFLIKNDIRVTAIVEPEFEVPDLLYHKNITIIKIDLKSIMDVVDKIPSDIDAIYHFAWVGVDSKLKNEEKVQLKNVEYGLNILKVAGEKSIKKVICPGSASEYACFDGIITGAEAPQPSDMYAATKVAVHYLMDVYAMQKGIDLIWTLVTSIYGPGRKDNNLITYAIKSFLKKEIPSFTKLEQRWDYLHISDLINALYLLGLHGKGGKVYPIGSGEERELSEYVEIIRNCIDPNLKVNIGLLPYKTQRIDNSRVDISRLQVDTGFKPRYTFEKGIRETIEYFKCQPEEK